MLLKIVTFGLEQTLAQFFTGQLSHEKSTSTIFLNEYLHFILDRTWPNK